MNRMLALGLGFGAFLLPFLLPLEGLSLAGTLTLAIFLLAAVFWILEPIPIHATSLSVILLQVLLLSAQGPLARLTLPPTVQPETAGDQLWRIPARALDNNHQLHIQRSNGFQAIEVEVVGQEEGFSLIRSEQLRASSEVALHPTHWQVEFHPPPHTVFLNSLANPIIILFLGGFTMAAAAAKYRLDRNVTRILLKPFGRSPAGVLFGMMAVTALLSAFMSNTATTAMMMAAILPVLAAAPPDDRFRTALVLAVPFAANLGGIATPIGTPPNAIALGALADRGISIPFTSWMALTLPLVLILLALLWWLLLRFYPSRVRELAIDLQDSFVTTAKAWILYVVAGTTVLLWMTEALHGISSSIVALLPITLLCATQVLEKKEIRNLPWEILWLMAGGLSLGLAMRETGLAEWVISLIPWGALGAWGALALFGLVATLVANFISNTVTATLLMPLVLSVVVAGAAEGFAIQTAALTVAVGSSLGMALPISTPPNAIAMSTGMLPSADLGRIGALVGALGYGVLLAMALIVWNTIF